MDNVRPAVSGDASGAKPARALGLTSYAWSRSLEMAPQLLGGILSLLDEAERLDVRVVQLCENSGIQTLTEDGRARVLESARDAGIELELGVRARSANELSDAIGLATSLGCHLLRVVAWSGAESRQPLEPDRLTGIVREVLPALNQSGVVLAIENYFDIDDLDLATVIDQLDDELVGICYDTANSVGLLREPLATAAVLAPRAVSVHLKDFTVLKQGAGYRITGSPLGRGWLDVSATLALIDQSPRRPHLLLELWVEPEPTRDETALKERAWLAASVDFARALLLGHDSAPDGAKWPRTGRSGGRNWKGEEGGDRTSGG